MSIFNVHSKKRVMVSEGDALPGRNTAIETADFHYVSGHSIHAPYPDGCETAVFGMGCFWGAERKFWSLDKVYVTAVGYAGGFTENPTYEEVCSGATGHNEVVLVVYEGGDETFKSLLKVFFESHDPTQGMQQGNDVGTQYRSAVYYQGHRQKELADQALTLFQSGLAHSGYGYGSITTEILPCQQFYYAEAYHQQYLAKNPNGYCGLGGTGVCLPDL